MSLGVPFSKWKHPLGYVVASICIFGAYVLFPFKPQVSVALMVGLAPIYATRLPGGRELIFLTSLFMLCVFYFVFGADEIRPKSIPFVTSVLMVVMTFCLVFPLFLVDGERLNGMVASIAIGVIIYTLVAAYKTITSPDVVTFLTARFMVNPIDGSDLHSTEQINAMALSVGLLLFVLQKRLLGLGGVLLLLLISILFQNRTGMMLSGMFVVFWLVLNRQILTFSRIAFFLVFISLLSVIFNLGSIIDASYDAAFTRFDSAGLETERWEVQGSGVDKILHGDDLFGGAQPSVGTTYWYHNVLLDSYRVFGFPALFACMLVMWISAGCLRKKASLALTLMWLLSMVIALTCVIFESHLLMYELIFATFSLPVINNVKRRGVSFISIPNEVEKQR